MERNYKIDYLKGLAALLVVFGHVIQYGDPLFNNNIVFTIIYSFHITLLPSS